MSRREELPAKTIQGELILKVEIVASSVHRGRLARPTCYEPLANYICRLKPAAASVPAGLLLEPRGSRILPERGAEESQ